MNASTQGYAGSGAMDPMPTGSMLPTAAGDMPGGTMNAAPAESAMSFGAMPAAAAQGSAPGMPIGGMVATASAGMPTGAMTTEPGGSESWNMDLAAPDASCGC